jgi:hypothetical protein
MASASEEAAFDKVHTQPAYRDDYLSVTQNTKTPAADVFAHVWPSRSIVTRLLEQRQANARTAGTELGNKLDQLRDLRRRLDRGLQDTTMKSADRDKLLVEMANQRD